MNFESILFLIFALGPLLLGMVWRIQAGSFSMLRYTGMMVLGAIGMGLLVVKSADPTIVILEEAVVLAGFCVLLSQNETEDSTFICSTAMIVLGLALGFLTLTGIMSKVFLIGLLVFAGKSIYRDDPGAVRTNLALGQIALTILCSLVSGFSGTTLQAMMGIFITVIFLPLIPLHQPFLCIIKNAKGSLTSFWIIVWLAVGIDELHLIHDSIPAGMLFILRLLAFISAGYASLVCLGQQRWNLFIGSAVIAHVALIWGLLEPFPDFTQWGMSFGVTLALVMGGLCLAFSFIRQRYGWQIIGKLPGLASPMPRFGTVMIFLVSFAMVLPVFPAIPGLNSMPSVFSKDIPILMTLFIILVVWLAGGWYFSNMLHQTAYGTARSDVTYTDLRPAECVAVTALLLGATYSGLVY